MRRKQVAEAEQDRERGQRGERGLHLLGHTLHDIAERSDHAEPDVLVLRLLGALSGARVAVAVALALALAGRTGSGVGGQREVGRVARDRAGGVAAGAAGVAGPRDLGQLERPGEPPAGAGIVDDPLASADRGWTGPRVVARGVVARGVAASGLTAFRCHLGTAGRSGL